MVSMGSMVTTMDASIGEVIDNPTKYGNWLKVNAKREAKNNIKMSFAGTFSFFVKADTDQNSNIPPASLKKVSAYGLKISGISEREIGVFIPNIKLAEKTTMCPFSFLFSIKSVWGGKGTKTFFRSTL